MYNLLGGSPLDPDTGIKDAGVSVSRIIPAGKLFLEGIAEIYRGDSGTIYKSNKRSDFSTVEHLRAYADLTERPTLKSVGRIRAATTSWAATLRRNSKCSLDCSAGLQACPTRRT